jgi:hypothetical protein
MSSLLKQDSFQKNEKKMLLSSKINQDSFLQSYIREWEKALYLSIMRYRNPKYGPNFGKPTKKYLHVQILEFP